MVDELEQQEVENGVEEELVEAEPVEVEAEPESKIVINGGDDMSDMFEPPSMDDEDMRTDDLFTVNVEEDVMGGNLDDLTEVSSEDIMGEDWGEPEPKPKRRIVKRYRRVPSSYTVPTSIGGMNL